MLGQRPQAAHWESPSNSFLLIQPLFGPGQFPLLKKPTFPALLRVVMWHSFHQWDGQTYSPPLFGQSCDTFPTNEIILQCPPPNQAVVWHGSQQGIKSRDCCGVFWKGRSCPTPCGLLLPGLKGGTQGLGGPTTQWLQGPKDDKRPSGQVAYTKDDKRRSLGQWHLWVNGPSLSHPHPQTSCWVRKITCLVYTSLGQVPVTLRQVTPNSTGGSVQGDKASD